MLRKLLACSILLLGLLNNAYAQDNNLTERILDKSSNTYSGISKAKTLITRDKKLLNKISDSASGKSIKNMYNNVFNTYSKQIGHNDTALGNAVATPNSRETYKEVKKINKNVDKIVKDLYVYDRQIKNISYGMNKYKGIDTLIKSSLITCTNTTTCSITALYNYKIKDSIKIFISNGVMAGSFSVPDTISKTSFATLVNKNACNKTQGPQTRSDFTDTLLFNIYDTMMMNKARLIDMALTDGLEKPDTSKLGLFYMEAAVYTNVKGFIPDDNPTGLTQYYLNMSFYLDKNPDRKWFKDIFVESIYSPNVENDSAIKFGTTTSDSQKYVNRLDLYQHAFFRINSYLDIFATRFGYKKKYMFFFDGMLGFMGTNVSDPTAVYSTMYGANATISVKHNIPGTNTPVKFAFSTEVFWINPVTSDFNAGQNFQVKDAGQFQSAQNYGKNLTYVNMPYYHLDLRVICQLSKPSTDTSATNGAGNTAFLHLAYTSNFASMTSKRFTNNYFQAQIGVGLDINSLINKLSSAATPASTGSGQ